MKTGKKLLFVLLIAALMAALAVVAGAADVVETGYCGGEGDGTNLTWTLDSDGLLTISGTGKMKDYVEDSPFYKGNKAIKSVSIGNNVTSIGNSAFFSCRGLTSITISDSVTSIGNAAFDGCINLMSIKIPNSVTSIGIGAFEYCRRLMSIKIPDSVTSIGDGAFYTCSSLMSIEIPESVTSISDDAFSFCSSLTSIEIPDSVTSISDDAFSFCSSLWRIKIPNSVTSIGVCAFRDCSSLMSIKIPYSVTSIGAGAFGCCSSLTSIVVDADNPSYSSDTLGCLFNKDKTTLIQYPIGNARTAFTIPDSVTSIGDDAFYSCSSLTSIEISDSVTSIGVCAFHSCEGLTSVEIGDGVTNIGRSAFIDCSSLTSIKIPDRVTRIGERAFYGCSSLTSIELPDSVTYIGDDAFYGCSSLTSIEIPDSMKSISQGLFYSCTSLMSVVIPDSVRGIGKQAFYYCNRLKDVYYSGTEGRWTIISIGSDNGYLTNATIHFTTAFEQNPLILSIGTRGQLVTTAFLDSDLIWSSSDLTVATVDQSGVVTAGREGIAFITAQIGKRKAECKVIVRGYGSGVYSLGEETCSFKNPGDKCAGMSITSLLYHLGLLDKTIFDDPSKSLYDYDYAELEAVVNHYQSIQGSNSKKSMVVGKMTYWITTVIDAANFSFDFLNLLNSPAIIYSNWFRVKQYLKSHAFDEKGNLLVLFQGLLKQDGEPLCSFGHTVSFLRYDENNERVYIYDPNKPDREAYLYQDSDGFIKLGGYDNTAYAIYSIELCDMNLFNEVAQEYKQSRTIYGENNIVVENADASAMSGDIGEGPRRIMYEIPDDLTEVRIVPLTDHAEFTYMDQVFTIDREDENTIGILKLAETEEDTGTLTVINDPDNHVHVYEADSYTLPTCSEGGKVICKCTRCSDTVTETLDALGHYDNDDNNICDDCGKPMPATHTPGDINGDGVVNNKDLNRLMKKLAGENVQCVEAALDVNGDGVVNNKDLNRLMKKLAGENVEIH